MKSRYLLILFLTMINFAVVSQNRPENCPAENDIKYTNMFFDGQGCHMDGTCYASSLGNKFKTKNKWDFIIWVHDPFETNSESAKSGAVKALKTLVFKEGPLQLNNGRWACLYDNELRYKVHLVLAEE